MLTKQLLHVYICLYLKQAYISELYEVLCVLCDKLCIYASPTYSQTTDAFYNQL